MGRTFKRDMMPLEKVMVENSDYHRGSLKRRLLQEGMIEEQCGICGLNPVWNGRRLVLILDHANGISNDNRPINLRLLCPNCNSQTDTFAGKNADKKAEISYCPVCGKTKIKSSKVCYRCVGATRRKVKDRPSQELLKFQLSTMPWLPLARSTGFQTVQSESGSNSMHCYHLT